MKINRYVDISTLDKEAKRDYIDRHSPFISCEAEAKSGEKFKVNVKLGDEYKHPDDFDHHISAIQLWNGETLLAKADYLAGTQGSIPGNVELDFYIVPNKNLKLTATSYCTKHGLWFSNEVEVKVG